MAKIEDEDEAFAEEECTMDFTDEPEETSHPKASGSFENNFKFPEYPGEDFSQYLDDDDEEVHVNGYLKHASPASSTRGGQRPKSTYEGAHGYSEEPTPWELALSVAAAPVSNEPERNRPKDVIKDRVSKWLNTVKRIKSPGGRYDNQQMYGGTVTRLSDFSYADSKICTTGPGSDSGIDTRSVLAHSDTGYGDTRQDQNDSRGGLWDTEGQSRTSKDGEYLPKASSSTGLRKSKSSSNILQYSDAELQSPNTNLSTVGGGSSTGKKLSNAWKKLSNSLSRKPKSSNGSEAYGQYAESQLSYNSNNIYEDIRL